MQKTIFNILLTGLILSANLQTHTAAQNNDEREKTTWLNKKLLNAAKTDKYKIIKPLIVAGAQLETVDADGNTPLILASQHHAHNTAQALLEAKANPDACNILGNTALHFAISEGHKFVNILIENGANIHTINIDGMTPLMKKLIETGTPDDTFCIVHDSVVETLLEVGADLESTIDSYRITLIKQCPVREQVSSKKVTHEELSSLETIVPGEILPIIFNLLPQQDIVSARSVNSYWCLYAHDLFKQYKNKRASEKLLRSIKTMLAGMEATLYLPQPKSKKAKDLLKKEIELEKTKKLDLFSPKPSWIEQHPKPPTDKLSSTCLRQHSTLSIDKLSSTEAEEYLQSLSELLVNIDYWAGRTDFIQIEEPLIACKMRIQALQEFIDLLQIGLMLNIPKITTKRLANYEQEFANAIKNLEELEEQKHLEELEEQEELEINKAIDESMRL